MFAALIAQPAMMALGTGGIHRHGARADLKKALVLLAVILLSGPLRNAFLQLLS